MNPHGFPSRMTVGKMLEIITGKAAAVGGQFVDSTGYKRELTQKILEEHGFNYIGEDIMYTGMEGYSCWGMVYYQKLKHMVGDKIHARSTGPVVNLTRQPTEGRNRQGGLRIGEMERDCLIAYGASQLIHERLVTSSDNFVVDICGKCGVMGMPNWYSFFVTARCQNCRDGSEMARVQMPYAFKLLCQEMTAMNIVPKFILKDVV
ncbi:DNA-directed RNA polymerase III subunit RPC2-like [Octopus sinensis]|uniref:DNA-directed RNA polymerase n=1 Tax=Octopus sinensis TaxID=2607531 RepID=A0A6P7U2Y8_9MOLL|nr:DNA-directed RNA polymerase III subunit RPC2-like [Octopus sinensis]